MTKVPDVQIVLESRNVGFWFLRRNGDNKDKERGKPEYPEKKLSKQSREPTTNSTHI